MKLLYLSLFSIWSSSFLASSAWTASCCGGGVASPSIISNDDRAAFSVTAGHTTLSHDVYADGTWRSRNSPETTQTVRLEGAHILSDQWQLGGTIPIVERSRANSSSQGLGDVTTNLAYEFLPEWDYSHWRPKGIGFLQLTLPTGKSIHESEDQHALDSRGRGFWAIGAGALLTKTIRKWDVFASGEGHRSLSKSIATSQVKATLNPGWGTNLALGTGYNTNHWRYGLAVRWSYEDPVEVSGSIRSSGVAQQFATGQLLVSYITDDLWTGTLSYSDQTLFGEPLNTSLGRIIALQVQKRWLR